MQMNFFIPRAFGLLNLNSVYIYVFWTKLLETKIDKFVHIIIMGDFNADELTLWHLLWGCLK